MDFENQLEHFSLRWNNYNDNMKTGFHDLLRREDFVDVTIAAEGKVVQAHKMVLSICSPYFRSIFKTNPCQHPIVFLKDVTHKELAGVLQFMYLGEVSVRQEELGRFLKVAEALQIKGLTSYNNEEKVIPNETNFTQECKEQFKNNTSNTNKSKILSTEIPDKEVIKKIEMDHTSNELRKLNLPEPVMGLCGELSLNEHSLESKYLFKNDLPELDFYDSHCDRVSMKGEYCGDPENKLQDNNSVFSCDMSDLPNTEQDPGSEKEITSSQGLNEIYKSLETSQDYTKPPTVTKSQGVCPICGRILQHKKNLQTHIIDQHSGVFGCWPCKICHKVCRTWSALRVHTNRHHLKLSSSTGPLSFLGVSQPTN